jgi:hypothetical protein
VVESLDPLSAYAKSKGYPVRARIVLVEGTSDADLFLFASKLHRSETGRDLLDGIAFVPAGEGDEGGATGVVRELLILNAVAATVLDPSGHPRYRIAAVFDNDNAGRYAVRSAPQLDIRLAEFRNMFLLRPVMPQTSNRDPEALRSLIEKANTPYKGLDWEVEDLFPSSFLRAFEADHSNAVKRVATLGDKTHRDLSPDGKAKFHRFVKQYALLDDVQELLTTLRAVRNYVGLSS